jgi:hypothetical protein
MFELQKYSYTTDKTFQAYSFISHGPNGPIHKIAKFNELYPNAYNFGFGDYDAKTGDISDTKVSNNGDIELIMGTIGSIIYDFTNLFPKARVLIQGTNTARTRLYQMHITRHWHDIEPVFKIYGLLNDQWELFKKGINYEAFLGYRNRQSIAENQ